MFCGIMALTSILSYFITEPTHEKGNPHFWSILAKKLEICANPNFRA